MSSFLVNLARRGAGLPATPAAISAAPAAVFPTAALAPAADFVGSNSNDDRTTQLPHLSPIVASPFTPSRSEGDSAGPQVEASITPEPVPASTPSQSSAGQIPPAHGPSLQIESVRKRTQGTNIASTIERSMPSSPVSSPHQEPEIVLSVTPAIEGGHQDSNENLSELNVKTKLVRSSRRQRPNSEPRETASPSPATEASPVSPPQHWVAREEIKEGFSAPVLVKPAVSEPGERFALSRLSETHKPAETMPAPIHVRIGRIEVRGTPTPAAQAPRKVAPPAPLGFASYLRLRTYRNWPR